MPYLKRKRVKYEFYLLFRQTKQLQLITKLEFKSMVSFKYARALKPSGIVCFHISRGNYVYGEAENGNLACREKTEKLIERLRGELLSRGP